MVKTDSNNLGRMGRRRFLETVKGLGISGATLGYLSQNSLATETGNLKDEVPYVAYLAANNPEANFDDADENGLAPIYRKLPYDRWTYTQGVNDAAKRLAARVEKVTNSDLVEVRVSGGKGSNLKLNIIRKEIVYPDGRSRKPNIKLDDLKGQLPDKVDGSVGSGRSKKSVEGIKIEFENRTAEQQANFGAKYRPVPGGCRIDRAGFALGYGTTGTPAYHEGKNKHVMVTAGHVLSNGERAHQPKEPVGGGNRIGYKRGSVTQNKHDSGWIEMDPEDDVEYDLAKNDGGTRGREIDGIVFWDTIILNTDSGYNLYLQGANTGSNYGELVDYCVGSGNNEKKLTIDVDSDGGDSGGPHYRKMGDHAYIAGIHGWGSGTLAESTSMDAIQNQHGLSVNPNR